MSAAEEVAVEAVGLEAAVVTAEVVLGAVGPEAAVTAAVGLRVEAGRLAAVMVEPVAVEPAAEREAEPTRTFTVPTLSPGRLFRHSQPALLTTSRFSINSPTALAGL
jgi:hypothetical protein